MILIDFMPDTLAPQPGDPDILTIDRAVLEETGFEVPIRFSINDIDLFAMSNEQNVLIYDPIQKSLIQRRKLIKSPWLVMPLYNFATHGWVAVQKACKQNEISQIDLPEIGGYLLLRPNGKQVAVHSYLNKRTVTVGCEELLSAFSDFVVRVRGALNEEFPHLREIPSFQSWLQIEK
jgi:hypothetical protein